ncbi:MAG: YqeG family HAD IIIA-type phosphatase [Coriobacteriia bacterium]|nr:YqeG family HAD IIIA-type phosphatase [Coriobacteriia bacterium]
MLPAKRAKRLGMRARPLTPDVYLSSVTLIDAGLLRRLGVRALLMDINNTIVPRDRESAPDEVRAWISGLKAEGFLFALVTNNWHRVVFEHGRDLDIPVIYKSVKPLPFAYRRAFALLGVTKREAVMIGDQLLTDILGARLLGMPCIMVEPQSEADLRHILVQRKIERLLIGKMRPEA